MNDLRGTLRYYAEIGRETPASRALGVAWEEERKAADGPTIVEWAEHQKKAIDHYVECFQGCHGGTEVLVSVSVSRRFRMRRCSGQRQVSVLRGTGEGVQAEAQERNELRMNDLRYVVYETYAKLFVRYRPHPDGAWYTSDPKLAKTWKTLRGAKKWIDERGGSGTKFVAREAKKGEGHE